LHDAKVAEIAKKYQHDKRYNVLFGDDISEFHLKPDLVVKTKKTTTVFEVKVLPISKHYQRKINKLRSEAREKNYRFRIKTIA
jgi:cytidylate kinase